MFTELVIKNLQGGSKLYIFVFLMERETFEIVTTRDIALGFINGDVTLTQVWDY